MNTNKENSEPQNPTLECPTDLTLVILESPFAGDVEGNLKYARECMNDCLKRGEAPYASHLLYTQPGVLDDENAEERSLGIRAGMAWGAKASKTVVYTDLGISGGMRYGIEKAVQAGRPLEFRTIREGSGRLSINKGRGCCQSWRVSDIQGKDGPVLKP